LITEFDKVLKGQPYSVLPLSRLCESDPAIAQGLDVSADARLGNLTTLAKEMLRRPADLPAANEESLSRVGLSAETVDSNGKRILCRPTNRQFARSSKRKLNADEEMAAQKKSLSKLTVVKLQEIAMNEGVELPMNKRVLKVDYVEAIYKKRNPMTAMEVIVMCCSTCVMCDVV
jgi:hypothetical protein